MVAGSPSALDNCREAWIDGFEVLVASESEDCTNGNLKSDKTTDGCSVAEGTVSAFGVAGAVETPGGQ